MHVRPSLIQNTMFVCVCVCVFKRVKNCRNDFTCCVSLNIYVGVGTKHTNPENEISKRRTHVCGVESRKDASQIGLNFFFK